MNAFLAIDECLLEFEKDPSEERAKGLRAKLRKTIYDVLGRSEDTGKTLGEVCDLITAQTSAQTRRDIAVLLLRVLSVRGAFPESPASSLLYPKLINLFESALPDLLKRYSPNPKAPTFEKIQLLEQIDGTLRERISVLSIDRPNMNSFVSGRQQMLQALNDKAVSVYFNPYGFAQVKSAITEILSQISVLDQTNDDELGPAIDAISAQVTEELGEYSSESNQLLGGCYLRFLTTLEGALDEKKKALHKQFVCDVASFFSETGGLEKRYALHKTNEPIKLTIPLRNVGPGTIGDLTAELGADPKDIVSFSAHCVHLGTVRPGLFVIPIELRLSQLLQQVTIDLIVEWRCQGLQKEQLKEFSLPIFAQRADIDWKALVYRQPYSLNIARGAEFVGRSESLQRMSARLAGSDMRSFYITGKKRVGKSSLAQALIANFPRLAPGSNLKFLYFEVGQFACSTAGETLAELGYQLSVELASHLPTDSKWEHPSFQGTLAPLMRLVDLLARVRPDIKFVLVLDEFDEINQELYRFGELARTFFLNIRTLSAKPNLAFVLVGGERLVYVMAAQGDKLNRFERETLDTFHQAEEWKEYEELIRHPSGEDIRWCDSAIQKLYEETRGHPYFTKLICSELFNDAIRRRDSEITQDDVMSCLPRLIGSLDVNVFAHFWKDGIQGDDKALEIVSLKRCHVLLGYARTIRRKEIATEERIENYVSGRSIAKGEVPAILREFCARAIMEEVGGGYRITIGLFDKWLVERGLNMLIADQLGEDLADAKKKEEEQAYVTSTEIVDITRRWPLYQGREITGEDVRAWLQQEHDLVNQRSLFQVLEHLRFPSEGEIRERMRAAHEGVSRRIKKFVWTAKAERRKDILVTYVDGAGKSGSYCAGLYATENKISTSKVVELAALGTEIAKADNQVQGIVIVDDFSGTGESLSGNLLTFWQKTGGLIAERKLAVSVVVVMATLVAEEHLRGQIANIGYIDMDLFVGETISAEHYGFPKTGGFWGSEEDKERARGLCEDLGAKLVPRTPLGFGEQGLLLVFPMNCPNNSLPILHAAGKGAKNWTPLFPRRKV